jgi:pimeloyl-ACP methyl ester carboxylesterase
MGREGGAMSSEGSCERDGTACSAVCHLPCAECPGASATFTVAEAEARFEREAVRGTCDTGRYRMPFFSWGHGPPLVFVPGASDSSAAFVLPSAHLSGRFRCIAYDLPAGGPDGARLRRYRHHHLVEDLFALLDHLGLARAYALGSSFGSTVVLQAARARPERLPRLILQGGLAYRPCRRLELWFARLGRYLPGTMARVPLREKLLQAVNGDAFAGHPPELWERYVRWTGAARIAAFASQGLMLHGLDLRPVLAEVRQPVLMVCGDRDRVARRAHEEVLLRGLPNVGRVVLAGCGHVPGYSHPEALAEVVIHFLTPPVRPAAALTTEPA